MYKCQTVRHVMHVVRFVLCDVALRCPPCVVTCYAQNAMCVWPCASTPLCMHKCKRAPGRLAATPEPCDRGEEASPMQQIHSTAAAPMSNALALPPSWAAGLHAAAAHLRHVPGVAVTATAAGMVLVVAYGMRLRAKTATAL